MRLLNTKSLEVEAFLGEEFPCYAILSHTWEKEEVTLQDMQTSQAEQRAGYSKLRGCCDRARQDGYEYVWIDTCCIDKTSSSELSEAINSMYQWYKKADICYAYLVDIPTVRLETPNFWRTFKESRWFTRGWTLQELIAPHAVEFYAADWTEIGTKSSLTKTLFDITGIDIYFLEGGSLELCNVGEKLSWAASRRTSRVEDAAYCLLGIFQVQIPLLYGEGVNALLRLQEQILKTTEDYTLLALKKWHREHSEYEVPVQSSNEPAMARYLVQFGGSRSNWKYSELGLEKSASTDHLLQQGGKDLAPYVTPTLTAKGLYIRLPVMELHDRKVGTHLAYLYCKLTRTNELMCIPIWSTSVGGNQFTRPNEPYTQLVPAAQLSSFRLVTMFIEQGTPIPYIRGLRAIDLYEYSFEVDSTCVSDGCSISTSWNDQTTSLPWKSTFSEPQLGLDSICIWDASISLDTGDEFVVFFGITQQYRQLWKPLLRSWCWVISAEELEAFMARSELIPIGRRLFQPGIIVDRATMVLPSNLGVVSVSIRKTSSRLVTRVQIDKRSPPPLQKNGMQDKQ